MKNSRKNIWSALAVTVGFLTAAIYSQAHAAVLGATVSNTATVDYQIGTFPISTTTSPADFVIEAARTPSTIDFFRLSPNAPDAVSIPLNGSDFAASFDPSGNPVFQAYPTTLTVGATDVDLSGSASLVPAEEYFAGEVIFARVTDLGQNGDPNRVETITATIETESGDEITLRFYESGPDTGQFFAFVQSTAQSSAANDQLLTIVRGETITATYQDRFDVTEISTDVAGVDPFGLVFDSLTGAPIDGATVTIVDAATGQPAPVFSIDGVTPYPSTIVTGGLVTDDAGFTYQLAPGEFVFPIMFPGEYRLEIVPPGTYSAPSIVPEDDLQALPNAPFELIPASFLGSFILDGTGDVNFDVPLDPNSELLVTKTASTAVGSIGDFIRYEITIENIGDNAALLRTRDVQPTGFRYQTGSARLDGAVIDDPSISANGQELTFSGGALLPGETARISYVSEIAAGAELGDAVNRAFVVNVNDVPISNTGQASIYIREDLLRSNLTIIGRVSADACDPGASWPREIEAGESVEGVRLYMETGAYVTTDENGLYHFEDVEARTHVVQIDTATIPEGYEPVLCENNTRFAGSAISQFVDAQGGSVWRANFYLRKTKTAPETTPQALAPEETAFNDATEYKNFDKAWLNQQDPTSAWAYPAEGRTPSTRSLNIGIKHSTDHRVDLELNGAKVPSANFAGRDVSLDRRTAITRWRGVDLVDGDNNFVAIVSDKQKNEIERITRMVRFVTDIARAEFVPEESRLIADGQTPPVLAVRITDGAGRPVRPGTQISVLIDPPYKSNQERRLEDEFPLTESLSAKSSFPIDYDGIARIELQPTLQTGNARITVELTEGRSVEFSAYVKPELRDWIVVGLAEGDLSYTKDDSAAGNDARELLRDGRIAAFAKGTVKGGWLVTAAGDTAKRRGAEDDELFDVVDPDSRFAIFGDRSNQQFEAQSRYPFFFKAEKGAFQALFGDYDTGLDQSRLGKYTRRLSGVQSVYAGERFQFSGFAAETNQAFIRDEIAADGTSGPFTLSTAPLVRNSETIVIESRNRFRPDEIISTTPLTRFLDYDIEFETGEFIFRLPIAAANDVDSFNVIVAEYETSAPVERNIVAGGRGSIRFAKDRAEIGVTAIHEEGRPGAADSQSDLAAVDLRVDVNDTTRLRFEYGVSRRDADTGAVDGDAILAEVEHVSDTLSARAYFEETDAEFGLNQQSSGVSGVRRYGGEARLRVGEFYSERSGAKGEQFVEAKAYQEENLTTGATRSVQEVALRQDSATTSGAVGLRRVIEKTADNIRRQSILATAEIRQTFERIGLTLRASRDQPLGGENDSVQFPKRTRYGFDQRLFGVVTLSASHEVQEGDTVSNSSTIVGVTAEPWTGARLSVSGDRLNQDTGERLGATFGVDQQVQIDDHWSASFGVSRREELDSDGPVSIEDDIVPDAALSPLESVGDFTSGFVGLGYRDNVTTASARAEMRKSGEGDRYTLVAGAAREVSESLSFAGAARIQTNERENAPDERSVDARLGVAWRPRDNDGLVIFNRFDIKQNIIDGELNSWKAVNNLALNTQPHERVQLSFNHGFKYSELDANNASFSGVTQLFGAETRFDITDKIDIGLRGSALYSHNSRTLDYSYGPSIGVTPADNIWLSVGWNFEGFTDEDFAGAEFTREGPFIRLRVKFDQNTAKGLLDAISPGGAE